MTKCACGSNEEFSTCCGPFLEGEKTAPTAEALMRSRYTAYVNENIEYIKKTTHKTAMAEFDEGSARAWSRNSDWLGLKIIETEKGLEGDTEGTVEFVASYLQNDKEEHHHERAIFKREAGKWFFVDGKIVGQTPFVRETPKVGRNEPCPCGSGNKYKKCCGLKAQ
jgi:SEC-C motif-containing protein